MSHDLKTPMAGIISGLECLENIAKEQLTLPNLTVTHTSSINHMLSIVCNMRSINTFMLLTINRCLDYTKVSKEYYVILLYVYTCNHTLYVFYII